MNIHITVIPHNEQRYPTVGDWTFSKDGEHLNITVSELSDWRYSVLVAIHELIEVVLCKQRGISQEKVDQFDVEYERTRPEGDLSEPGDAVNAPYRREHFFATSIERLVAAELDVDWRLYDSEVESL